MAPYFLCLILFSIGLYCVLRKRNLIKIIIGIGIIEYAVNLFLVLAGYRTHGRSPILEHDRIIENMVDPLPQALVLTAIVIGLAVTALMVAIAIRIYEKYGTFDITKIDKLKGESYAREYNTFIRNSAAGILFPDRLCGKVFEAPR